jgi:hypothetical protein
MPFASPHVGIAWDISLGVLTHNVLSPPAIPAPTPMFSIEMVATNMWTLGYLAGQNKFTTTVMHKGSPIVQEDHDDGMMIPDITPMMMANLYYAVMWPFSSRQVKFKASTVKMNGKAAGCADISSGMVMMTCGDPISAPLGIPVLSPFNTVTVGMTLADFLLGVLDIALSMLIDFVFEYVGKGKGVASEVGEQFGRVFSRKEVEAAAQKAAREAIEEEGEKVTEKAIRDYASEQLGKELIKKFGPTDMRGFGKSVASSGAGLVTSSLEGNPTFKYSTGNPIAGESVSVDRDGVTRERHLLGAKSEQKAPWGGPGPSGAPL